MVQKGGEHMGVAVASTLLDFDGAVVTVKCFGIL